MTRKFVKRSKFLNFSNHGKCLFGRLVQDEWQDEVVLMLYDVVLSIDLRSLGSLPEVPQKDVVKIKRLLYEEDQGYSR